MSSLALLRVSARTDRDIFTQLIVEIEEVKETNQNKRKIMWNDVRTRLTFESLHVYMHHAFCLGSSFSMQTVEEFVSRVISSV